MTKSRTEVTTWLENLSLAMPDNLLNTKERVIAVA